MVGWVAYLQVFKVHNIIINNNKLLLILNNYNKHCYLSYCLLSNST